MRKPIHRKSTVNWQKYGRYVLTEAAEWTTEAALLRKYLRERRLARSPVTALAVMKKGARYAK